MPTTIDNYRIEYQEGLDRRIKLTAKQREAIRHAYATEKPKPSTRRLADRYGVSRRTIQFVINPDDYEKQKARARERRKDGRYYNREKSRASMQETRDHKRELLRDGRIDDSHKGRTS